MRTKDEIEEKYLKNINILLDKPEHGEDPDLRSDALKQVNLLYWVLEGE